MKVDKKGNILRDDKSILGAPIRTGKIYRGGARTGRIDLETGKVYNLKEQELGEVDLSLFGTLFDDKIAKLKEAKAKEERKAAREAKKNDKDKKTKSEKSKPEPEKTISEKIAEVAQKSNETYNPGKDSYLIVSGRLGHICWPHKYDTEDSPEFNELNAAKGGEFMNWIQLSAKADLSDAELVKYRDKIDWYTFLKFHQDRKLPESLQKYSPCLNID